MFNTTMNILSFRRFAGLVVGSVLGLIIGAAAHASTEYVTYTYDEARAGYHNTGQLTTISNGAAAIQYDYNSHGRLVRERYIVDGQTYARTYSYDDGNRLRARSFSDGETWPPSNGQYQYDRAGRLLAIPGAINQIHYSPDAGISRIDHANGTHTLNSYDTQRKWLLGTKLAKGSQVLLEEQYTRDTVGRISKIRSNRANGNWDYTYDSINQLTAATNVGNSALTRSFSYSPSGNLLSKSDVGTYSYPSPTAARPHAPTKAGSWTFAYDANGNMVSGKGRSLVYDGKDRPISVTMGGVTTQYVYGPDNKRLKKISGGQTTLYLGNDEEILPDGTVIKHLDGSVRRVDTTTNWIHRDHMSSVRMLTNNAGAIAAVSRYQPYGKRTDVQQAADTPRESKGWIGERDDPETGLTYLNARYYDADLARFIQSDWYGPTDPYVGTNRYGYALNNPISFKDPSGHRIDDFNEIGNSGVTSGARNQREYGQFREARNRETSTRSERRSYDYSDYRENGNDFRDKKSSERYDYNRFDYGNRDLIDPVERAKEHRIEAWSQAQKNINPYGDYIRPSLGPFDAIGGITNGPKLLAAVVFAKPAAKFLGANGVRVDSKTLWKGKGRERLDVENPNPSQRPGQLHYQDQKNIKHIYDPKTNSFPTAPASVNKLLKNNDFRRAIDKGLKKYLGE